MFRGYEDPLQRIPLWCGPSSVLMLNTKSSSSISFEKTLGSTLKFCCISPSVVLERAISRNSNPVNAPFRILLRCLRPMLKRCKAGWTGSKASWGTSTTAGSMGAISGRTSPTLGKESSLPHQSVHAARQFVGGGGPTL